MEQKIRLILADDHQLFRHGLKSLFDSIHDIEVIDEACDGDELIQKYLTKKPDLVLADISMPKLTGFEAFKQVRRADPKARFLFLSMFDSPEYIYYTRKIGASGLIGKNVRKDELEFGIREVLKGKEYFGTEWPPEKLEELESKYRNLADAVIDPNIALTAKEKLTLYYISEGYTSEEIAEELQVSKRTVDSHRHNLMKKVKANSSSQLIAFAIKFTSLGEKKSNGEANPSI